MCVLLKRLLRILIIHKAIKVVSCEQCYYYFILFFIFFISTPTGISVEGDFWAQPVEIPVFPSPTSYMLTSFGFPYWIGAYSIDSSKLVCKFRGLELQLVIPQTLGHFIHKPQAVTVKLWEPTRKCSKAAVSTHDHNHVMWSQILKFSVKSYVTGPSTKCYVNEFLLIWVLAHDQKE